MRMIYLAPMILLTVSVPAMADVVASTPVPAPLDAATSVSIGSWLSDLLQGLVGIFGSVISVFLTKWVMAVAKKAGIDATQAMSDKLDAIITRGLHDAALNLGHDLTGKLNVQIKNQVVAQAVTYAQAHGAETVKDLVGVDINDPKVVQALQARAATALNAIGPDAVLAPKPAPAASVYPINPVPVTVAQAGGGGGAVPAAPETIAPVVP